MAKYKVKIAVEIEIHDAFVKEGYNEGDMVENEVDNVFNGSGLDYEIIETKKND